MPTCARSSTRKSAAQLSSVRSPQLTLLGETRVGGSERRSELYSQVQTLVMEDALILPIRDYVNLNGVRRCVSDLRFDTRGWFPILHDVQLVGSCR